MSSQKVPDSDKHNNAIVVVSPSSSNRRNASHPVEGQAGCTQGIRRCAVCLDDFAARQLRVCSNCFSGVCRDCMHTWLESLLYNGHATRLHCVECRSRISATEFQFYCPELYKKYLFFVSKERERNNPLAVWCPNDSCHRFLSDVRQGLSPSDKEVSCPDCSTKICAKCFSFVHKDGKKCPGIPDRVLRRVQNNKWERRHTHKCPNCAVKIQKSGGCDVIHCTRCTTTFCWKCGTVLEVPQFAQEYIGRRFCKCERGLLIASVCILIGGTVIAVPLTVATAAVLGPPCLLAYMVLPKSKKESVKQRIAAAKARMSGRAADPE